MSKSPSLRRIQADVRELALDPSDRYAAAPLEHDMFEWHFTIRGADGTDFEGGIYHGRILLPPEYPFKPPHIVFLTPSGRFETNVKVCLSFSAFHPELWQPAWGIRLILEALIAFLPSPADGAVGALDWTSKERKNLAIKSQTYVCPHCGPIVSCLPVLKKTEIKQEEEAESDGDDKKSSPPKTRFAKEIESLLQQQQQQQQASSKKPKEENETTKPKEEEEAQQANQEEEEIVFERQQQDDEETEPAAAVQQQQQAEEQNADAEQTLPPQDTGGAATTLGVANATTPREEPPASWMLLDPLLHLMIVLLAMICYLLLQKWNALYQELLDLRSMKYDA